MIAASKSNKSLYHLALSVYHNYKLIIALAKREVLGRYQGSIIGLAWSFINPLLLLGVYTFIFTVVFKARWGIETTDDSQSQFAIILFAGLIVHGLFAECFNRAPALVVSNPSYVKKIVFPLEILPFVALGGALFHAAISLLILLVFQLVTTGAVPLTAVLFPLVLFPLLLATLGVSWILAAFGVYIRDFTQISSFVTTILLFLSPVFYPISILPKKIQTIILLNPLTLIIEESRKVLIFGEMPDWTAMLIYTLCSVLLMKVGYWIFQNSRRGFADVL